MNDDFFRARIDQMIDLRHPRAVLAARLPWQQLEQALAPCFARDQGKIGDGAIALEPDLFGEAAGQERQPSNAGRPRLPLRLMISLLYLKHAYDLSDEELVMRWSESPIWQYFSGLDYYEMRAPCDATQIGRFRTAIGEAGVEEILKATIDTAVQMKAIQPAQLERIILDTTVQEKAIAHPTDSRLRQVCRHALVKTARQLGVRLKQTYAKEGRQLRWKTGRYGHARQFRRMRRAIKRQRTIVGRLLRDLERRLADQQMNQEQFDKLQDLFTRVRRILSQAKHSKNKLYALHAPEVECISKGKARKRYEFGVKVAVAVTHKGGLIIGARSFPGNPYDGHILAAQLEQTNILLEDTGRQVKEVHADLGFRGVDKDNPGVHICHRGKSRSLTKAQRRHLRRRPAIEPVIGHLKSDNRMARCWLKGATGDAIHAVLCAAGYLHPLAAAGGGPPWVAGGFFAPCSDSHLAADFGRACHRPASAGVTSGQCTLKNEFCRAEYGFKITQPQGRDETLRSAAARSIPPRHIGRTPGSRGQSSLRLSLTILPSRRHKSYAEHSGQGGLLRPPVRHIATSLRPGAHLSHILTWRVAGGLRNRT